MVCDNMLLKKGIVTKRVLILILLEYGLRQGGAPVLATF